MEQLIWTAATAAVSAGVGALVAALVTTVRKTAADHSDSDRALKEGMRLILHDKVLFLTKEAVKDGSITLKQRTLIHQMIDTAHALSDNGEMTACGHEIDKIDLALED